MYFESCYPIKADLFFKQRFEKLKNIIPNEIYERDIESTVHYFRHHNISEFLTNIVEGSEQQLILYSYEIQNNKLIEKLTIIPNREVIKKDIRHVYYKFVTLLQSDEVQSMFESMMCRTFGILLYGEILSKNKFIARDEVCMELSTILKDNNDKFTITWTDGEPYINHFFMIPKKADKMELPYFIAVGGQPKGLHSQETEHQNGAYFYFMKTIDAWENNAYIDERIVEQFFTITNEELEMITVFRESIAKQRGTVFEITPVAKPNKKLIDIFGQDYYKNGFYFLTLEKENAEDQGYYGIRIEDSQSDKFAVINTGNIEMDLPHVLNLFDTSKVAISSSSSIDHYLMDLHINL